MIIKKREIEQKCCSVVRKQKGIEIKGTDRYRREAKHVKVKHMYVCGCVPLVCC